MQAAGEGSGGGHRTAASQLLLILSDGVFSEDPQSSTLQAAVRLARDHQLFVVCVIIDDLKKKVHCILFIVPSICALKVKKSQILVLHNFQIESTFI